MYCRECGARNDEKNYLCIQCGERLHAEPPRLPYQPPRHRRVYVKNWLMESILVTIFCCMPLGIVAIVFAAQVDAKAAVGDTMGATELADKARLFVLLSLASFFVPMLAYIFLIFVPFILMGLHSGVYP